MNLDQHPYLHDYLSVLTEAEQNLLMLLGIVAAILVIYWVAVRLKRQREAALLLTGFFWLTFLMAIWRGV